MSDIEYLNECMVRDLATRLVETRHLSIADAVAAVFQSHTYESLQNPRTGLYFQSPVYVFCHLEKELASRASSETPP